MIQVLPPGEMEQLTCKRCSGMTFRLHSESRDGKIDAFHSLCETCGKRGILATKVEVTQTREFTQFADPPPGSGPTPKKLPKGFGGPPLSPVLRPRPSPPPRNKN